MKKQLGELLSATGIWAIGVVLIFMPNYPSLYVASVGFFVAWVLRRKTFSVSFLGLLLLVFLLYFAAGLVLIGDAELQSLLTDADSLRMALENRNGKPQSRFILELLDWGTKSLVILVIAVFLASLFLGKSSSEK